MSKYIEVDKILGVISRLLGGLPLSLYYFLDQNCVDIVKCKECKYWHREINENGVEYINFSKCAKGHYGNGLDFYCADGEREGE